MEITDVRVRAIQDKMVKAYASIIIDDCLIVRDLKVIQGENRLFVAMPSKKMKDGSYRDMIHPLNNEIRQLIEASVLQRYELQKDRDRMS